MAKEAVIMVLYDSESGKVLSEERQRPDRAYFGQRIFPGGVIEPEEIDNPELTVRRELEEEMGIKPVKLFPLESDTPIGGGYGEVMHPYLISEWEGDIPERDLSNNNPFVWETLDEVAVQRHASRDIIVGVIKDFLAKNSIE